MPRAVPPYGRRSISGMDPRQLTTEAKGIGERIDLLGQERDALEAVAQSEQETSREREIAARKVDSVIRRQNRLRASLSNIIEEVEKQREAWSGLGSEQAKYDNQLKRMERVLHSYETKTQSLTRSKKELAEAIREVQESEKVSDEDKRKYIESAEQLQNEYDKQLGKLGKLGNISKEVTKLGGDMMSALGAGGVGKYVGKAGLWGALTAGVVEFTGALKNAHDQLRAVRNEGILLGGMMGGPGGAMGGRGAAAGQFMGRSFAHRLMTGQTEQEQAQFMGAGIRTGVFSTMEDVYGRGGRGAPPGGMTQMWALGRATGIAPESLLGQGQELMKAGVPRGQIGQALLDLANNARDAGAGVEEYMNQVLSLNQSTRMYGATLEENELIVRHFMKQLQLGTVTMADLTQLTGAGLGAPGARGARGFLAEAIVTGHPYLEGIGEELRGTYAGMGPMQAQAQMRWQIEHEEGHKYVEIASKFAESWAREKARLEPGADIRESPEALGLYSLMMESYNITTPKFLEAVGDFKEAAKMLDSPAELMKKAATGFMEGQGKFEKNIADLTKRVAKDYDDMKSLQQKMEEVIRVAMFQFTLVINDWLAAIPKALGGPQGLFKGTEGAKRRARMITGFGRGMLEAERMYEEGEQPLPTSVEMGLDIVRSEVAEKYATPIWGQAGGKPVMKGFTLRGGMTREGGFKKGELREILGSYGQAVGDVEYARGRYHELERTKRMGMLPGAGEGKAWSGQPPLWAQHIPGGKLGEYEEYKSLEKGFSSNIMRAISRIHPETRVAKSFTPVVNVLVNLDTDVESVQARIDGSEGELMRKLREAAQRAEVERKNKLDEETIRSGVYKGW